MHDIVSAATRIDLVSDDDGDEDADAGMTSITVEVPQVKPQMVYSDDSSVEEEEVGIMQLAAAVLHPREYLPGYTTDDSPDKKESAFGYLLTPKSQNASHMKRKRGRGRRSRSEGR
jgi:hypothetical protein